MSDVAKRVELALDRIRPALQMDGGDIKLVEWLDAEGLVRVELTGSCVGCGNIANTTYLGVERVLKQLVPEVRAVQAI